VLEWRCVHAMQAARSATRQWSRQQRVPHRRTRRRMASTCRRSTATTTKRFNSNSRSCNCNNCKSNNSSNSCTNSNSRFSTNNTNNNCCRSSSSSSSSNNNNNNNNRCTLRHYHHHLTHVAELCRHQRLLRYRSHNPQHRHQHTTGLHPIRRRCATRLYHVTNGDSNHAPKQTIDLLRILYLHELIHLNLTSYASHASTTCPALPCTTLSQ
jgi:hypothetical protein